MRRGGTVKETGPKRDTNSNGDALKIGDCFAVSTTCWFGDRCELTREAGEKRVLRRMVELPPLRHPFPLVALALSDAVVGDEPVALLRSFHGRLEVPSSIR